MPTDVPALPDVRPFAELARGPVASVFKAFDASTGEIVLLKALRPGAAADAGRRARFADEARLAATVVHPNVVRVRRVSADGAALVADWVEGRDLQAVLDAHGALPAALAAYVAREAAQGLAAVHAAGIVHRDVKPANVLLGADGSVRLTDFGLASLAAEPEAGLEVRGTLATLAPEIVRGGEARPASDVFSLGAVLVHALTGVSPFAAATASDTLDAVLHADAAGGLAADPRVPPTLAATAAAALDRDPDTRPTADALARHLDALAGAVGRAGAADLAAFLDDPAAYRPPAPDVAPASLAGLEPPVRAEHEAAGPRADARPPVRSRSRRLGLVAGLATVALVGVIVRSARDSAPARRPALAEAPARGPLTIQPSAPDTAGLTLADAFSAPDVGDTAGAETPEPAAMPSPSSATPTSRPEPLPSGAAPSGVAPSGAPPAESPPAAAEPAPVLTGTLAVAAEPWAAVRIDGRAVGTTPFAPVVLAAGTHEVAFENPGFPTYTTTVRVLPGETARAAVSLWQTVARVTLDVAPWAVVWVDGRRWDTVPPQTRPLTLAPGAHTLRFEHPTLGSRETTLRVAAGEQRTVQIRLTGPPR